ncbi:putative Ig domain-containing protein [Streptacidiphilus cavernicola]|uniref:Ig domain-containing protein n=1 Tax=Streptacidiphilus cavernicola TaxID=3342716 RepID=A0ABV6VWD1_9ACTN
MFGLAAAGPASAASTAGSGVDYRHTCAAEPVGYASCQALVRTDVKPQLAHPNAVPLATVSGYGPTQLQSAYNLASAAAANGAGETVAVVDAYDYPSAQSDLNTYRSQFGLAACGTGCFSKINENGQASPLPSPAPASDDWTGEEALDIDMVSAICPNCHILLVEATSPTSDDLGKAVNAAVNAGAKFVSNSYGGSEATNDPTYDSEYYNHPGVAVTASSGDSGYGVEYPAASQYVTSVGGTALSTASNARGWSESVWSTSSSEGAGSGCSKDDAKPSWQTDTGCAKRTVADVSAVADPATGVAVYDTYNSEGGWNVYGGTSVASPIIASVFALAGNPASGTTAASYPYAHTSSLYDVTTGKTATCSPAYLCTAEVGYDGPTGLGTPNGTAAFSSGSSTGNTVTVTNPGSQTGTVGTAASLQIHASDSASGQTLSYSATGLPAGLSISSSTGLISGTPTASGSSSVTVTATDGTGASGSTSFSWTVSAASGGCTAAQLLGNPGFETGKASPWTASTGVIDSSSAEPAHSGSWKAWLDGYGTTHTDTLSQTVTVPASCTSATFSFYLHIDTSETTRTTAYDTLKVQVGSTTLATYSNLNKNTGYAVHSFDLSGYAGQTVTLKFTGSEDISLQTSFVIDDTSLNVD